MLKIYFHKIIIIYISPRRGLTHQRNKVKNQRFLDPRLSLAAARREGRKREKFRDNLISVRWESVGIGANVGGIERLRTDCDDIWHVDIADARI